MGNVAEILEILMIVAFGLSWPNNILTTLRNKSTKGKSLTFLLLIDFGYICGIISKILSPSFKWYVMFFYVLNFIMVSADLVLYFYYRSKEKKNAEK
ncbi:MAG: hypothetical protein J5850_00965 [Clostridia bacterium]|nr:hypothetical protein [Clostridia bacterium]